MSSEVVLPSAGKGEFAQLQDKLGLIEAALQRATAGVTSDVADGEALADHDEATKLLDEITARASVFERRAREPDPDKRIYGPKMAQKVLTFCDSLLAAIEHAEELGEALMPLRERVAEAEAEAAVAAAVAAEATMQAELEAAAATAAEEAVRKAEAQQAAEHAAAERAAAIARPLGGGAAAPTDEMDWLGRRPLVAGLTLAKSLELLQQSCEAHPEALAAALQALHLLCSNIIGRPEEATFRKVRLLNGAFQESVAQHAGGVEALLALGFDEVEGLEEEAALFYVMEEPNLELDLDGWGSWYDALKAHQAEIEALMDELGVRALPPAAKGTGWAEGTTAPAPARPADNLTLHGQHGGGL